MNEVPRMQSRCPQTNPTDGTPVWSPPKSLWYTAMTAIAIVGGWQTFTWSAAVVAFLLTVVTLCLGHSLGYHRLLIHRSFECPRSLEYALVYLGVLVGYIAHNSGSQPWIVEGAAVQGRNIRGLGLLTMGEAWHNNHHAFPESARLGLEPGQNDPAWWALSLFRLLGLIKNVRLPENLPKRDKLRPVVDNQATIKETVHV